MLMTTDGKNEQSLKPTVSVFYLSGHPLRSFLLHVRYLFLTEMELNLDLVPRILFSISRTGPFLFWATS
jgi:hypothetical protein